VASPSRAFTLFNHFHALDCFSMLSNQSLLKLRHEGPFKVYAFFAYVTSLYSHFKEDRVIFLTHFFIFGCIFCIVIFRFGLVVGKQTSFLMF
jgi:hypothetical protein